MKSTASHAPTTHQGLSTEMGLCGGGNMDGVGGGRDPTFPQGEGENAHELYMVLGSYVSLVRLSCCFLLPQCLRGVRHPGLSRC